MDQITGKRGTAASAPLLLDNPSGALAPAFDVPPASFLRRLYRQLRPMQRSPVPSSTADAHDLQLIPAAMLTRRLDEAAQILAAELGSQMGAYLEFGVYNGSSMLCMREALRKRQLGSVRMYGFDSFQGLPDSAVEDDGGVWHAGQFSCPRSITEQRLAPIDALPNRLQLIEGWYSETLTRGDVYGIGRASIVMIDCDTYSSARHALCFVAPLLTDPSIILFDDWKLNDLDVKALGEYKAFHEWAALYPVLRYRTLPSYNRKSRVLLLRRA